MYQKIKKIDITNKVTIEQLYSLGKEDMGNTLAGHESVDCDYCVLNIKQNDISYAGNSVDFEKYYAPVKRVIRHKVTKDKWSLIDSDGNEVIITNDHSLMVLRDGNLMKIKPYDIDIDNDLLVTISGDDIKICDIIKCDRIGNFEDEYVYDIEIDDDTHTFVANNILVHNSIYASFKSIVDVTDWMEHPVWRLTKVNKQNDQKDFIYVSSGGYPTEADANAYFDTANIDTNKFDYHIDQIDPEGREFCLTINRVFMSEFLKKIHEEYADRNGTPNILDFELEAYNEAGIWLAKKKYIKNMTWAEPNVYYDSCTKIKSTGVEMAQTSSSVWVKKQLTNLVIWIFKQENFAIDSFIKELTKVKKQFMMQNVETISVNKGMNKYSDYVLNDTNEIELGPKAMVTVQGAAFYNHLLNNNERYKKKYSTLFDSDKLCVVYIKPNKRYNCWKTTNVLVSDYAKHPSWYRLDNAKKVTHKGVEVYENALITENVEAFSYPSGLYPMDLAEGFEVDYNRMFELLILGPVNRIITAMGYQELDISMSYEQSLW